jgi:hypothetical protein
MRRKPVRGPHLLYRRDTESHQTGPASARPSILDSPVAAMMERVPSPSAVQALPISRVCAVDWGQDLNL